MAYEIYLIDGDASTNLGADNRFETEEEALAAIPGLAEALRAENITTDDLAVREIAE